MAGIGLRLFWISHNQQAKDAILIQSPRQLHNGTEALIIYGGWMMYSDWFVSRLSGNQSHSCDINSANTYVWLELVIQQHDGITLSVLQIEILTVDRISCVGQLWEFESTSWRSTHPVLHTDSTAVIIPIHNTYLNTILTVIGLNHCSCVMVAWCWYRSWSDSVTTGWWIILCIYQWNMIQYTSIIVVTWRWSISIRYLTCGWSWFEIVLMKPQPII